MKSKKAHRSKRQRVVLRIVDTPLGTGYLSVYVRRDQGGSGMESIRLDQILEHGATRLRVEYSSL